MDKMTDDHIEGGAAEPVCSASEDDSNVNIDIGLPVS